MNKPNNRSSKSRDTDKSDSKSPAKRRTFKPRKDSDDKPFKKREDGVKRSYGDKDKKPFDSDRKPFRKRSDDGDKKFEKPFKKREDGEKRSYGDKDKKSFDSDRKPFRKRDSESSEKRKYGEKKEFDRGYKKTYKSYDDVKHQERVAKSQVKKHDDGLLRLNKYLSNAGVCSRREADELIKAGAVSVNGKIITELGFRIDPSDKVNYGGETLRNQKKVYLILNKPKDYITTTDDPRERRTVMELIQGACKERVYPVGRLDRNTTGLLLFTNDGEMATKLMHPKLGIRKVYHVLLDKKIKPDDYKQLHEGIELEDGFIKPDDVSFVGETKKEIGIEIHSGKNRVVRRIFEQLGYDVLRLDRVVFAGLTKKDLPRGKWRILGEKEISFLKMIG